jgi:hypothetical protein
MGLGTKNDRAGEGQQQFTQPVTQLTEQPKTFVLKMTTADSGETLENHQHSACVFLKAQRYMPLLKKQHVCHLWLCDEPKTVAKSLSNF